MFFIKRLLANQLLIIKNQSKIMAKLADYQAVLDKMNADIAAIKAIPVGDLSAADEAALLTGLQGVEASLAALIPAAPVAP